MACEVGLYYVLHITKQRNKNALLRLLPGLGEGGRPVTALPSPLPLPSPPTVTALPSPLFPFPPLSAVTVPPPLSPPVTSPSPLPSSL